MKKKFKKHFVYFYTANNEQGFSLVEALMAVALFILAVFFLSPIQTILKSGSKINENRSEALRLAASQIDRIRLSKARESEGQSDVTPKCDGATDNYGKKYDDNTDCSEIENDANDAKPYPCEFKREIGADTYRVYTKLEDGSDGLVKVDVKCCWIKNEKVNEVVLTTLVSKDFF